MKKQHKKELRDYSKEVAEGFSNRKGWNTTFNVLEIIPTSESTANVIFERIPDNKRVIMFFYRVKSDYKAWRYFVPTDSHILGMECFKDHYMQIEAFNFNKD